MYELAATARSVIRIALGIVLAGMSQGCTRGAARGVHLAARAKTRDLGAMVSDTSPAPDAGSAASPTAIENANEGTDDSALTQPATHDEVAAYASATSIAPGETLQLHVDVDHAQAVSWQLYRVGYYQGHGARLMTAGGPTAIAVQPACPIDAATGLIECAWSSAFEVAIDPSWPSGYYFFKVINAAGMQCAVPLIVREAASSRRAPILVQASVTTWQAYNLWGGTSLYKNNARDPSFTRPRAHQVSFDRPYDATARDFMQEAVIARWLEQRGYDVAYTTNLDVDADSQLFDQRRVFITVWHDEYWTVRERDALEAARDAHVSLMFLSANTGYWRIRLENSSSGVPRRVITCYKSAELDPRGKEQAADVTVRFRDPPAARPENALIGVMNGDWSDFSGFPFVVRDSSHWIFAGTGVAQGETLQPIVGIEWDGVVDNGWTPPGLEVISESPVVSQDGLPDPPSQATIYYPSHDSFVFAAGSIAFIKGLDGDLADARVARMTENLLARAGFALASPTDGAHAMAARDIGHPARALILAGGSAGDADGAAGDARFNAPAGVAAGPADDLYIADTGNNAIRRLDANGEVSTLARCLTGTTDSDPGACLDTPIGIAVDANGTVYVSDSGHQRIRRISSTGELSDWAGSGVQGFADSQDLTKAEFSDPRGIALGPHGELYVADFGNGAIRRIDDSGVTTLARKLGEVTAVAVDGSGTIYFAGNHAPQLAVLDQSQPKALTAGTLHPLEGLCVSPRGDQLLIADSGAYRVRALDLRGTANLQTVLGDGQAGPASDRVTLPRGITRYRDGYAVADSGNHRIVWFSAP